MAHAARGRRVRVAAVWGLGALPLCALVWATLTDGLGPNPAERWVRDLGEWALRLLCLTLALTPLRTVFKQPQWQVHRRALGVWAGLYAMLHLLAYVWLDQNGEWARVWADVLKRPFIAVGMLAGLLLLPLLLTSFNAAVRTLGGTRWRRLHAWVYLIAPLAVLHLTWMRAGKQRYAEAAVYAAVVACLLGWRAWRHWREVPGRRP